MSEYTITMTVQADKDGGVNIGRIERILRAAGLDARVGRQVFQGTPLLHTSKPRIVVDCSCCDDTDCDCPCSTDENYRRYESHCHAYDCDNDQTVIRDPDTGEPVDGYEHALAVLVEGLRLADRRQGRTARQDLLSQASHRGGAMSQPSRLTCQLVDLRDESSCVRCGKYLIGNPASRHHRKRRSQASRMEVHSPSNLIDLCGTGTTGCHGWVHAHPEEAREYGWLLRSTENPKKTPMLHALYGWVLLDDQGHVEIIETNERKALI